MMSFYRQGRCPGIAMLLFGLAALALPSVGSAGETLIHAAHATGEKAMRIRITVGSAVINATLADNETAKDFASLLPLDLTMSDHLEREKTALLPRAISTAGPRSNTYKVGDVILWSPRPSVAIFYRHDGQTIPAPGSILIAKADAAAVQALAVPGVVRVSIERLDE
ncbi:cyclophilin-like fold protein [Azotobacter vinelandii]